MIKNRLANPGLSETDKRLILAMDEGRAAERKSVAIRALSQHVRTAIHLALVRDEDPAALDQVIEDLREEWVGWIDVFIKDELPVAEPSGPLQKLRAQWCDLVGLEMAGRCEPAYLSDDGRLELSAVSSKWAEQVQMSAVLLVRHLSEFGVREVIVAKNSPRYSGDVPELLEAYERGLADAHGCTVKQVRQRYRDEIRSSETAR